MGHALGRLYKQYSSEPWSVLFGSEQNKKFIFYKKFQNGLKGFSVKLQEGVWKFAINFIAHKAKNNPGRAVRGPG